MCYTLTNSKDRRSCAAQNALAFRDSMCLTSVFIRDSLQTLQLREAQMLEDLARKQEALYLEQRSMLTRQHLNSAPSETEPSAAQPLTNSSGMHRLQLKATDWHLTRRHFPDQAVCRRVSLVVFAFFNSSLFSFHQSWTFLNSWIFLLKYERAVKYTTGNTYSILLHLFIYTRGYNFCNSLLLFIV